MKHALWRKSECRTTVTGDLPGYVKPNIVLVGISVSSSTNAFHFKGKNRHGSSNSSGRNSKIKNRFGIQTSTSSKVAFASFAPSSTFVESHQKRLRVTIGVKQKK